MSVHPFRALLRALLSALSLALSSRWRARSSLLEELAFGETNSLFASLPLLKAKFSSVFTKKMKGKSSNQIRGDTKRLPHFQGRLKRFFALILQSITVYTLVPESAMYIWCTLSMTC
jgi:hypothetical protein